ncbi:MAG: hypothetical protein MUF86_06730 [Akkermansiaceae bacterium]|nr:hypothetical protein [Akkermansiaceae bacterium]MCU0777348.1 hypothetical protein [Akkermansiaceae bacterium]
MKPSIEQLESLLALKRYERPEEGYWQDFLGEFHHRQRQQAVANTGIAGLWNRVTSWFADVRPSGWAYGAGLAYATATIALFVIPRGTEVENQPAAPVNYQVVPSPAEPVEQLEQLDLSPETQGSVGEQVF